MTDENWNFDDWKVDFPTPEPYFGSLTGMPLTSKVIKVTRYLIDDVWNEVKLCLSVKAELAALMLCLASVDYMAGYFSGHKSTDQDFIEFMQTYFPQKYHPYLNLIYRQLRCGIVHSLVASNPWSKDKVVPIRITSGDSPHLELENETLSFNVGTFLMDCQRAWVMYGHSLIMKSEKYPGAVDRFHRRFNRLGGIGSMMLKTQD